jgi:hypothetical protein
MINDKTRTLPPSVSRLSRQCGILNISQPYWAPRPVSGIALLSNFIQDKYIMMGQAVASLVETLYYKLEGRGVRVPIRSSNFFNSPNPFSSTMALGLTQPGRLMSTKKCFWGIKRGQHVRLTTLPPSLS